MRTSSSSGRSSTYPVRLHTFHIQSMQTGGGSLILPLPHVQTPPIKKWCFRSEVKTPGKSHTPRCSCSFPSRLSRSSLRLLRAGGGRKRLIYICYGIRPILQLRSTDRVGPANTGRGWGPVLYVYSPLASRRASRLQ